MNTYIFLGGAIVAEVIGTTFMKYSEGFTRLWPSVGTAIRGSKRESQKIPSFRMMKIQSTPRLT